MNCINSLCEGRQEKSCPTQEEQDRFARTQTCVREYMVCDGGRLEWLLSSTVVACSDCQTFPCPGVDKFIKSLPQQPTPPAPPREQLTYNFETGYEPKPPFGWGQ